MAPVLDRSAASRETTARTIAEDFMNGLEIRMGVDRDDSMKIVRISGVRHRYVALHNAQGSHAFSVLVPMRSSAYVLVIEADGQPQPTGASID